MNSLKLPKIIESYEGCGVDIGRIVRRVLKYAPEGSIDDLEKVSILDSDPEGKGFACYLRSEREIRLFAHGLVSWQPWILKKTYLFPFITVGLALGHEIDHHVNRNINMANKERSAENNAIKYLYPSLGILKPIVKMLTFFKS